MPKMKTHRGAAKRFSITGGGHVKRHKAGKRHLATGKPRSRKRALSVPGLIAPQFEGNIKNLIPYK